MSLRLVLSVIVFAALACADTGKSGDSVDTGLHTEGDCSLTVEVQTSCEGCVQQVDFAITDPTGQAVALALEPGESRTFDLWAGDLTVDWAITVTPECEGASGEREGSETFACDAEAPDTATQANTFYFYCSGT